MTSPLYIGALDKVIYREEGPALTLDEWIADPSCKMIVITDITLIHHLAVMHDLPSSPHIVANKNHKHGSDVNFLIDKYDGHAALNGDPLIIEKTFSEMKEGEAFVDKFFSYIHPLVKVGVWQYLLHGEIKDFRYFGITPEMTKEEAVEHAINNIHTKFIMVPYDVVAKG